MMCLDSINHAAIGESLLHELFYKWLYITDVYFLPLFFLFGLLLAAVDFSSFHSEEQKNLHGSSVVQSFGVSSCK